ncbi:TspO/MBR family protein [Elusimicrobiota bacterium]
MIKTVGKFIVSIAICHLAGVFGTIFTTTAVESWYNYLNKPVFSPPNWVFGPAWAVLYTMMGIALFIVWIKAGSIERMKGQMAIFSIQLLLNVLWTVLFFGLKMQLIAFVEMLILIIAIFYTIISFYKISKAAAYLLIPYILWVGYAAVLNMTIALLN